MLENLLDESLRNTAQWLVDNGFCYRTIKKIRGGYAIYRYSPRPLSEKLVANTFKEQLKYGTRNKT